MNEDIKRLNPYRVRLIGTPVHGLEAIEVNGCFLTIPVAARLLSRSTTFTTKGMDK